MYKKIKVFSCLLIILNPIFISIVKDVSKVNVVKAEENNRKIKQVIKFSDNSVVKALKEAYNAGEINISEKEIESLQSEIDSRGYWGENKIVQFWDGAIDVYISGFVLTILSTYGAAKIIKYIPALLGYSDVASALSGGLLGGMTAMSNGIVIYFTRHWVPTVYQGLHTGGYHYAYKYSHWRSQ